ncbi:hypothetical protein D046_2731B, partial [Vibrio parahaemolyticus V-223/04]
TNCLAM